MWIAAAIPLVLIAGAAFVVGSAYLDHRRAIEREKVAYPAPGELVAVGPPGAREGLLHVYAEGVGNPTLVFLSGLGTSSPYYDFRTLFERLSDHYRIAVVERAGYGWSEVSARSRDLATVLEETRTALRRAGESPPYVLFPHSMAGLEALLWAERHSEEVEAIIGLDPLVPGYEPDAEEGPALSRLETLLARTGLMRSGPDVFDRNFPAMVEGRLDPCEAAAAETIFMRRTHTQDMWDEVRALEENLALVRALGPPDVPVHAFVSGQGTEAWIDGVVSFATASGGEAVVLDAGHYVHLAEPVLIAEKSRELIEASSAR